MPDRDKIIRGLERCIVCNTSAITSAEGEKAYRDCEYTVALYCRQDKLLRDVLELLKEQEPKKPKTFTVIDVKTGEYPDLESIALHEDWAKGLVYCDMEGFAIEEDGTLLLMDECDNSRYCPVGRFEVVWEEQEPVKPVHDKVVGRIWLCGNCGVLITESMNYCHKCGKRIEWESR